MNSQYFLVLAVIIIMGWFAIGVIYNLRRGDAILKWLQTGLPQIGERTTLRWLGTSVVELGIAKARAPFRRLETILVFKPRDVFWMTILARLRGRDDTLIFRAHLEGEPALDLELADPGTWTGRTAVRNVTARGWESVPYRGGQLLAPRGLSRLAAATLDSLTEPMAKLSPRYARFALRKKPPHLEIHVPFPSHRATAAADYVAALRELARAVTRRS